MRQPLCKLYLVAEGVSSGCVLPRFLPPCLLPFYAHVVNSYYNHWNVQRKKVPQSLLLECIIRPSTPALQNSQSIREWRFKGVE